MTSVSNRRSMMGLYSGNICIRSHQVRFVLSEKGIVTTIDNFDGKKIPEDLFRKSGHTESRGGDISLNAENLIKEFLGVDQESFENNPFLKFYSEADFA